MSGQQGKKNVIEIVFVLNKENTFGLQNDVSVIEEGIRLPLTELSPQFHDVVREAMRSAQITATGSMRLVEGKRA